MPKLTKPNENNLKKALIEAYVKSFGNITTTCNTVGIARITFYEWVKRDPIFKNEIENSGSDEYFLDFLESKLAKRIEEGSDTCLIFALKTKGKKRGYTENSQFDIKVSPVIEIIKNYGADEKTNESI